MAIDLLKKTRLLSIASLLALSATSALGCASESSEGDPSVDDGTGSSTDDITQVDHTTVKRQSIGNCWLYAVASWYEALNKASTNEAKNTSESYLTYWHWYEQLANGRARTEISTGGSYGTAVDLITRYGIVMEKDFIKSEAEAEMSARQSAALEKVNASLKTGPLKDAVARRDKKAIRRELDAAWQLDAEVVTRMNAVFGAGVEKTIDRAYQTTAPGNGIIRSKDFPARLKDTATGQFVNGTLADAIGTSSGFFGPRSGKFAFNTVNYPSGATARRDLFIRVQKALHDQVPVVMSWRVDFNALSRDSRFTMEELATRGPGRQGGHMTVMHDYEAEVPGVGLLKAGTPATPEQMQKALSPDTKIKFVRVKNSWGGIRPDRWSTAAIPGFHDMDLAYLNGPIKECPEAPAGQNPDPATCTSSTTPLWDVVLPAGY